MGGVSHGLGGGRDAFEVALVVDADAVEFGFVSGGEGAAAGTGFDGFAVSGGHVEGYSCCQECEDDKHGDVVVDEFAHFFFVFWVLFLVLVDAKVATF